MTTTDGPPERIGEMLLSLLRDAGVRLPDDVVGGPGDGELTLLWHRERVAVIIGHDGEPREAADGGAPAPPHRSARG